MTAHDVGAPYCAGELEMVVSFSGPPPDSDLGRGRVASNRSGGSERRDPAAGPAHDPV